MDQKTRKMINDLADYIRIRYHIPTPINNFEELIQEQLGGILQEEESLPKFADARIEKNDNSFIIRVLRNANENRKRFSIAHELGHLFIHMGYTINDEVWHNSDGVFNRLDSGELEFQANEFAAALLMPQEEFIATMYRNFNGNNYDMESVAEFFGVSVQAAINRGKWLNLLSWG